MNRLFLLDGMALVYRAHFALIRSPILTSKGVNTSALYGFINTLLNLLENQNPTHLGVAFDTSAPTPRHLLYPAYKAQRDSMPEELAAAIPQVKRLLEAFDIPVIELDGWEADDLIGTLAKRADESGKFQTFMVTPDKDFAQLVSSNCWIWRPGRHGSQFDLLGVTEICNNWEINDPKQVVDILGLWGDASDNIPGVPGIGEKTAKSLISRFGSMEQIYQQLNELKGKQLENLTNFREQAFLSKELARIITNAPVELSFDALKLSQMDEQKVKSLFTEFEFNSLGNRLFGKEFQAGRGASIQTKTKDDAINRDQEDLFHSQLLTINEVQHQYHWIDSDEKAEELLARLHQAERFCFDLETTGLDPRRADLLGIAFALEKHQAYYISHPSPKIIDRLRPIFASQSVKVGHNLKFDISVLHEMGILVAGPFQDTMLIHSLLSPEQRHGMDYLAESLLGYQTIKLQDLAENNSLAPFADDLFAAPTVAKAKKVEIDMYAIKTEALAEYAAEDADITWQLAEILLPKLSESGMRQLYEKVEAPLIPVLARMECTGIRLDAKNLSEASEHLQLRLLELQKSITRHAGQEFNLNSPKQLGEILFDRLKLAEKPKKTKTGQYVTNEQVLSTLANRHPIVAELLEYRESSKLKSTYLDALPLHLSPKTGRIHTHFHQILTSTGRLASSDPNIQNIPIRSEAGRQIRKAFVARNSREYVLLSADYSQIELRIMAALAEDDSMIEAFHQNLDIHQATASKVFDVHLNEVTQEMRRSAKMVNFGIIYGISAFGLSQRLDIPRGEAVQMIDSYFKQYPKIQAYMHNTVEQGRELGYVETLCGRRRWMSDLNSSNHGLRSNAERAAINMPIQGTAADMIKLAMTHVDHLLIGKQSKMLLQVHDELVFDLHREEANDLVPKIVACMERALPLPHAVPIKVETGTGDHWLAAH